MDDKALRKIAKHALQIAREMAIKDITDKVYYTDIPLSEIYDKYFDAPKDMKDYVMSELARMRKEKTMTV